MQDVEELSAKYEELNTKYNAVIAELANLKKKKKERLFN
jgi:molecular chaperone GrpE (heat shock protein)